MIAELLDRALGLGACWWLTMTALVACTISALVWWAARYADERDNEGWRR